MTESLTFSTKNFDEVLSDPDTEIDLQIKELNYEYHEALTDKPEILKYIQRLHTIIRRQQKKLNKYLLPKRFVLAGYLALALKL